MTCYLNQTRVREYTGLLYCISCDVVVDIKGDFLSIVNWRHNIIINMIIVILIAHRHSNFVISVIFVHNFSACSLAKTDIVSIMIITLMIY